MHTTKVSKKARNQRNPLEGQPKPTTTTTTTITSTHREDARHNSSTLDTQLVENAITRTILLETTYIQHCGLIFCPYLPSIVWRVACMYIVHLHLLCDGTKWGGKMEENQLARESPTNLEIDLHLFRIVSSRTAEPHFLTMSLRRRGRGERASEKSGLGRSCRLYIPTVHPSIRPPSPFLRRGKTRYDIFQSITEALSCTTHCTG
jgi:hypothetical protein